LQFTATGTHEFPDLTKPVLHVYSHLVAAVQEETTVFAVSALKFKLSPEHMAASAGVVPVQSKGLHPFVQVQVSQSQSAEQLPSSSQVPVTVSLSAPGVMVHFQPAVPSVSPVQPSQLLGAQPQETAQASSHRAHEQ